MSEHVVGAVRVWGAFALLMILAAVPLFSTVLPPLFDYPNHLARMHLLSEGGNAFYAVQWRPLPNLAQDLIVPPLARLVSVAFASKLFLVVSFGMTAAAVVWLNRLATGGWRIWPLMAFLFLYNRVFLWGFVNYLFGIGVALCGIALWLSLEPQSRPIRVLASSLAALSCYISHIAAFGFYALAIFGVEMAPAGAEMRAGDWRGIGLRIATAVPQFLVPAALFLGSWQKTAVGPVNYGGLLRKPDLLFSVFDNYDRAFDVGCFLLLLGFLGWLALSGRLGVTLRLGSAAAVVFVAYLLLPSQMYGGSGADHRIPLGLFLLLIAASAPHFANRRTAVAAGGVALFALFVRLALIEQVWRAADRTYSAGIAGIDALPRGAKLAVAYPASAVNFVPIPEVHFANLAVARREAFVPTLFAIPSQQPITVRAPYVRLAAAAQPERLWSAFVLDEPAGAAPLPAALQDYDYIAFTDNRPVSLRPGKCLKPVFKQQRFQIFAVVHAPDCVNAGD